MLRFFMESASGPIREYSNGEVTVIWEASKCTHSTNCWKGLPRVFNPRSRPWVNIEGAGTEAIIAQVSKCPSGALTYRRETPAE